MSIHVFDTSSEPATRYNIGGPIGQKHYVTNSPRALFYCRICGRKRWAAKLRVKVYYDAMYFFCAGGCPKKKRKRTR